ncbi:energy transducer TonB [Hymenobacter humi]|uniref:Energy transducer TonB n=1 Tax=Hymenobacter humi TaxID=1411620 RepID=A0ABW2U304_9BACT
MLPADSPFAPLPAPGPHPATAELRAYAAGALPPAEEHRIEAHTLDCERCADLVAGFSMSDAAITEQAVADLRTRLQTRVGGPEVEPTGTKWAWPRLAAAAALLGVVASGLWVWEQRETPAVATVARQEIPQQPTPAAPPAAPEPAVQASPPLETTAATATVAEAETEPAKASYAVATPPAGRRARPMRSARQSAVYDKRLEVPDMDAATDLAATAEAAETQETSRMAVASPKAKASMAIKEAAAPVPAPDHQVLAEEVAITAPDSAAAPNTAGLSRVAQDKIRALAAPALGNATAARVAATPMPAGPSIGPAPVGGTGALRDYIRKQALEFVPEDGARPLSGVVRIKFVVGADGKLSNLKVTRGLRGDYDAEALRIVCEGPAWQPGVSAGRRAPLPMEVSVPF